MKKHHSIDKYFNTLLIFMSFFLFWPLYKGNTTLSPEVADRMIPVFSLIRTAVWNFELPLWNPFQDQGWATALVPTFWNPVHLILGGLFASPHLALNSLFLILIIIAGLGFYKFSSIFLNHPVSRIIAGLFYSLCGFFLVGHGGFELLSGAAWSPLILYLIFTYIKNQHRSHLLFLAVCIYLFSTSADASFVLLLTGIILLILPFRFFHIRPLRLSNFPAFHIWIITTISSLLTAKIYYEQILYFTKESFMPDTGALSINNLTRWNFAPISLSIFLLFTGMNLLQKPRRTDLTWTSTILISALFTQLAPSSDYIKFFHPVAHIFFLISIILLGLRGIEKTATSARNKNLLIFLIKTPFSILILGILIIISGIFHHFYHQDQFYHPVPVKDFESHLYKPEKKIFSVDPNLPVGKKLDQDFTFDGFHHNTGTYASQIVKDGFWPYESRLHNDLKNSNKWTEQMRFPIAYLSRDQGNFLPPDHLRFDDQINIRSASLNRFEIDILTPESAQLIFNQNYHKNWRGYLNDKILPIHPSNISMIKMKVPAGLHQLTLEYTSGGIHHLFWTLIIFLSGCVFLILKDHFSFPLLLPGIPLLIIGTIRIFHPPVSAPAQSPAESSPWDYQMNYESKQDFWYLRAPHITTKDSYDGYRAEEMNENQIYSATLQIPRNALTGKKSIRFRFYSKAVDEAELAAVAHSHTSDDEFYNIHYLHTFQKGEWEVHEGELLLPATSEPLIRTDFYIWNHKKEEFLIDNIQIQLIQ